MKFHKGHIHSARLTPDQVLEMRELYSQGWTQRALGERFNLGVGQVGRIVRGEAWRAYTNPGERVSQPLAVAEAPESDLAASQARLEKLMAQHLPKADPLKEFLSDSARERYLGQGAYNPDKPLPVLPRDESAEEPPVSSEAGGDDTTGADIDSPTSGGED